MKQWWNKLTPAQKVAIIKGGVSILVMSGWTIFVAVKEQPIGETETVEDLIGDIITPIPQDPLSALFGYPQRRRGFNITF